MEHPVTEFITRLDLVELQIHVAMGYSLLELFGNPIDLSSSSGNASLNKSISIPIAKGHAIECRLCAEDPNNNFLPCPGKILKWKPAILVHDDGSIRFDSGVSDGSIISVYYDSMICKIIAFGKTRKEAIQKLEYALLNTILFGIRSNKAFIIDILRHESFKQGKMDTMFISKYFTASEMASLSSQKIPNDVFLVVAMLSDWYMNRKMIQEKKLLPIGFRNSRLKNSMKRYIYNKESFDVGYNPVIRNYLTTGNKTKQISLGSFDVLVGNRKESLIVTLFAVEESETKDGIMTLDCDIFGVRGKFIVFHHENDRYVHSLTHGDAKLTKKSLLDCDKNHEGLGVDSADENRVVMLGDVPGKVLKVYVKSGEQVKKGQLVVVVESMKMENKRHSPLDGITTVYAKEGDVIQADTLLMIIEVK